MLAEHGGHVRELSGTVMTAHDSAAKLFAIAGRLDYVWTSV